jgi:hypothetical protein
MEKFEGRIACFVVAKERTSTHWRWRLANEGLAGEDRFNGFHHTHHAVWL